MEPPVITRHRRPFLAPVWIGILAVLVLFGVALAVYRSATTTVVVVVRTVESEPGKIDDPPLSPEGEQRAEHLAEMFGQSAGPGRLDAIYVSDARRAQQTAAPLIERVGKAGTVVPGRDAGETAARVMREHEGGNVLVVESGAMVPDLVRELSGFDAPPEKPGDEHNGGYIVSVPTFGRPSVLRFRY